MNEFQIKSLMQLILCKSYPIIKEIQHELISFGLPELNTLQLEIVDKAIKGALISGMKATIEKML
jgi:hypothetical protein